MERGLGIPPVLDETANVAVAYLLPTLLLAGGLHGVVTRGPTTPLCKVGVPCSAPAVGVVIVFSRQGHAPVRVRTAAEGRYSVRLAPGYYGGRLNRVPRIGTGIRPLHARVTRGLNAQLDFSIDTGIR